VAAIPHSRPDLSPAALAAAAAVLQSGQLAQGEHARRLERRWCELTGMAEAAAVGSGLAALRLALLALDVGSGDEVIVPAYSCVALLNAPLSLGATPVLADVLEDDWTLDVGDVSRRVTPRTRAIVAVDLFGMPSRIAELDSLGLPIVEDCAHGIGGRTSAGVFGGGSAASISSFYATKMIGVGEGGIVAVREPRMIERVREARDYGDRLPDGRNLNDKLTEVEAVLALEQLDRLDEILGLRARLAARYAELLTEHCAGLLVLPAAPAERIWYRYVVRLADRDAAGVCAHMAEHEIHVEQPVWDLRGWDAWSGDLPVTSRAFDRVVSLPLYPGLSEQEQERVVSTLKAVLQ
jgi:dTDP-4-amino-4,6-dideoxygalactose transaminase